jgi:hypothetical protein
MATFTSFVKDEHGALAVNFPPPHHDYPPFTARLLRRPESLLLDLQYAIRCKSDSVDEDTVFYGASIAYYELLRTDPTVVKDEEMAHSAFKAWIIARDADARAKSKILNDTIDAINERVRIAREESNKTDALNTKFINALAYHEKFMTFIKDILFIEDATTVSISYDKDSTFDSVETDDSTDYVCLADIDNCAIDMEKVRVNVAKGADISDPKTLDTVILTMMKYEHADTCYMGCCDMNGCGWRVASTV